MEISKTVQLLIYVALTALCVFFLVIDTDVYNAIAQNKKLTIICTLLWVILMISYLFVFIDLTLYQKQRKNLKSLDYAVHSDPIARIANRYGCDEIIDRYADKPMPENMAAIVFELTSLYETNLLYKRAGGNRQIRAFSIILMMAASKMCFVGRNGGNKFLAIFEDTTAENMDYFLTRLKEEVDKHNLDPRNHIMRYSSGIAYHEPDAKDIRSLIVTANERLRSAEAQNVTS